MGMYLGLHTLSDQNVRKVLADPPLIWKVVAPDDPEPYAEARKEQPGGSPQDDLILADDEVADEYLDKAWHGIHYLLTQTAWEGEEPLNFLVSGGTPVGDIDVGYGPARAFSAAEVKEISAALRPIDERILRERFNPAEMLSLGIYPQIWDRDPAEDDTFRYCAEHFESLKAFMAQVAERDVGLIVTLS